MNGSANRAAHLASRRAFVQGALLSLLGAAGGLGSLVACQPATQPPTPTATAPAPAAQPARAATTAPSVSPASLRFGVWFGPEDIAMWKNVVSSFKQTTPGIGVEIEAVAWDTFWQKLATQIAAGDVWDVHGMVLGEVWWTYGRKGQLVNLRDFMKRDGVKDTDYFAFIEEGRWPKDPGSDGMYMLPWRGTGGAFVVNKSLLAKAGLEVPKAGWTWDNWRTWAKQLRDEKAGVWGTRPPTSLTAHVLQAGAPGVITEDLQKSNWLDPRVKETIQFFVDLILTDRSAPKPEELPQGPQVQDLFLSGKGALDSSAAWNIPAWRKAEFDWDVVPQPVHKTRGSWAGPDDISIPTASKNKDAAWQFVRFSTHEVAAQRLIGSTGVPVLKEYALSDAYIGEEAAKKPANYRVVVEELAAGRPWLGGIKHWFEVSREIGQLLPQIFNGKVSVDEGLKAIDSKVNEILSRPD